MADRPTTLVDVVVSESDRLELARTLSAIPNGFSRAAAPALNRTISSSRTRVVRRLAKLTGLKQKSIRPRLIVAKASPAHLVAAVRVSGKGLTIYTLGAREDPPHGVSYTIPGDSRAELPHAFEAKLAAGHTLIFQRDPQGLKRNTLTPREAAAAGSGKLVARFPLAVIRGPSLPQLFTATPGVVEQEMNDIAADLQKNMASQVDRLLSPRANDTSALADNPGDDDDSD